MAFLVLKCGQNRSKVSVLTHDSTINSLNDDSEAATNVTSADDSTINDMPSGPNPQNVNISPEAEMGDAASNETNRANLMKRLSYLQKFSALIARHEN